MAPTYRLATAGDSKTCFELFVASVSELGTRLAVETITGGAESIDRLWPKRQSLFQHLASEADRWWVAEDSGRMLGYARSVLRDGVRQLTEFFVRPEEQSAGIGRELLQRAFPSEQARARILLATPDSRALIRYLKSGLLARFPVFHFHRPRHSLPPPTGLRAEPLSAAAEHLEQLARVDRAVLGFRRDQDHRWLLSQRDGYLYSRDGAVVGYGYVGLYSGPFAALEPATLGPMLAHAESTAPEGDFGVEVPLINRSALDYLLRAGYRMDPFANFFMSDVELGAMDRYVVTTPSFVI